VPRKQKPTDDDIVGVLADPETATFGEKARILGLTEKQLRSRLTSEVRVALRERLDDDLRGYAATLYKNLVGKASDSVTAAERLLKELADAEGRAASRARADADVEIISEVVPPNNQNKGRRPKKKS